MPSSIYLQLASNPGGPDLSGESQAILPSGPQSPLGPLAAANQGLIELMSVSFDAEQTINIGSATGGVGAGKVTFNPVSFVKRVDKTSPQLFLLLCSGVALKTATLYVVKYAGGASVTNQIVVRYVFSLVALKTIAVNLGESDEAPTETVTFEYGGVQVSYAATNPDGTLAKPVNSGWNRVTNTQM